MRPRPGAGAAIAGAAAASVLLRLRFLTTPLSVDEAGAVTVARAWQQGQHLYTDTFIDRPQGVVVVFQQWEEWFGPSPAAVRMLALIAGVAVVLGTAVTARAVSGRWETGAVAAWLVAVISSSAAIEGHTANGELLAGALAVPAMALAATVACRRAAVPWLLASGALAAAGLAMKQSSLDVLAAVGLWILVAAWQRWRTPREAAAMLAWLLAGAASVLGALALHGASLGWDAYTYALVGFRLHARSAVAGPQAGRFGLTLAIATVLLGPAVALAAARVRTSAVGWRQRIRPGHVLVLLWTAVACAGFVAGGNYHRHYWIQLAFPIAALAALGITSGPVQPPRALVRATALALVVPLAASLVVIARPSIERDPRVDADAAIARWFVSDRTSPDDDLLPLCASVTWYPEADQLPRAPYLWVDHVRSGRGGIEGLVRLLDSDARPTYLAMHNPADRCDPTGRLRRTIERHYRPATTIDGVDVLRAR